MSSFTPLSATLGGILLGVASALLFFANGRILGISGVVGRIPFGAPGDRQWRVVFLAGLLTGALGVLAVDRDALAFAREQSVPLAIAAGVLVGVGDASWEWVYEWSRAVWHRAAVAAIDRGHVRLHAHGRAHGVRREARAPPRDGGFVIGGNDDKRSLVVAFVCGALFAIGLGVSGMTHPAKVLAFLDVAGAWDPSLAFVMGAGVLVNFVVFRIATRRGAPLFAPSFSLPSFTQVDARLIAGAAIFGVGWGLGGFCPGPALVSAVTGAVPVIAFVLAMIASMAAFDAIAKFPSRTDPPSRRASTAPQS